MHRQKKISEMISDACEGCPFLDGSCTIPGGTCWKRPVDGIPGQFILDILKNTGGISAQDAETCDAQLTQAGVV